MDTQDIPNPNKDETVQTEDWRNEHGLPDHAYLQSLATDAGAEAMEKLRSIADDLDASYDVDASAGELVDVISSAAERNEDGNLISTT